MKKVWLVLWPKNSDLVEDIVVDGFKPENSADEIVDDRKVHSFYTSKKEAKSAAELLIKNSVGKALGIHFPTNISVKDDVNGEGLYHYLDHINSFVRGYFGKHWMMNPMDYLQEWDDFIKFQEKKIPFLEAYTKRASMAWIKDFCSISNEAERSFQERMDRKKISSSPVFNEILYAVIAESILCGRPNTNSKDYLVFANIMARREGILAALGRIHDPITGYYPEDLDEKMKPMLVSLCRALDAADAELSQYFEYWWVDSSAA